MSVAEIRTTLRASGMPATNVTSTRSVSDRSVTRTFRALERSRSPGSTWRTSVSGETLKYVAAPSSGCKPISSDDILNSVTVPRIDFCGCAKRAAENASATTRVRMGSSLLPHGGPLAVQRFGGAAQLVAVPGAFKRDGHFASGRVHTEHHLLALHFAVNRELAGVLGLISSRDLYAVLFQQERPNEFSMRRVHRHLPIPADVDVRGEQACAKHCRR